MNSKKLATVMAIALAMVMLMPTFSAIVGAKTFTDADENYLTKITSKYTTSAPVVDGSLSEWGYNLNQTNSSWWFTPTHLGRDGMIWVFVENTADHIYVAVDVTPDNTSSSSDAILIGLDLNNDGKLDANDTQLAIYGSGGTISLGVSSMVGAAGFEKTAQANWKHRVWEASIDMAALGLGNDTAYLYISGSDPLMLPIYYYPVENKDGGSYPTDVITAEVKITAKPELPVVNAPLDKNTVYAVDIMILAAMLLVVMMLAFSTIWDKAAGLYSEGKYWTTIILVYGLPLLMTALAIFQYYYNWVGRIFGL